MSASGASSASEADAPTTEEEGEVLYSLVSILVVVASKAKIRLQPTTTRLALYLKSSGETRFIQSLNLSTTSSSGASSIASSNSTAASSITSSAAKISAPARTARAMASDGLEIGRASCRERV